MVFAAEHFNAQGYSKVYLGIRRSLHQLQAVQPSHEPWLKNGCSLWTWKVFVTVSRERLQSSDCNHVCGNAPLLLYCVSESVAFAHDLDFVFQFGEAVRVRTSSTERALPGCPVSTGRGQDTIVRWWGDSLPILLPHSPLSAPNFDLSSLPCCWVSSCRALTKQRGFMHQRTDFCSLRRLRHHITEGSTTACGLYHPAAYLPPCLWCCGR